MLGGTFDVRAIYVYKDVAVRQRIIKGAPPDDPGEDTDSSGDSHDHSDQSGEPVEPARKSGCIPDGTWAWIGTEHLYVPSDVYMRYSNFVSVDSIKMYSAEELHVGDISQYTSARSKLEQSKMSFFDRLWSSLYKNFTYRKLNLEKYVDNCGNLGYVLKFSETTEVEIPKVELIEPIELPEPEEPTPYDPPEIMPYPLPDIQTGDEEPQYTPIDHIYWYTWVGPYVPIASGVTVALCEDWFKYNSASCTDVTVISDGSHVYYRDSKENAEIKLKAASPGAIVIHENNSWFYEHKYCGGRCLTVVQLWHSYSTRIN
jgi:hypothetical protein